jgi:hypothetical protein
MSKRPFRKDEHQNSGKTILCWQSSRALVSKSIPIELDLENREILINNNELKVHRLEIDQKNIDRFISEYIDPSERRVIVESLSQAGKGVEKPIRFAFIHPRLRLKLTFEFRYEIMYVSYSKTRLKGEIVKLRRRGGQKN